MKEHTYWYVDIKALRRQQKQTNKNGSEMTKKMDNMDEPETNRRGRQGGKEGGGP